VIDVFVEELDLAALGFEGVVPEAIGRPASSGPAAEDLRLRLQQPNRLEPPAGDVRAGVASTSTITAFSISIR
jgi:hypothetical protein